MTSGFRSPILVLAAALCTAALSLSACDEPMATRPAADLAIDSVFPYVDVGMSVTFPVSVYDVSGDPLAGERVQWESRDTAVARVVAGVVTGVSTGTALIVASVAGHADSVLITVEPAVRAIMIQPSSLSVAPGRSIELRPAVLPVRTAETNPWDPIPHSLRFASSHPSAISVSEAGVVRAAAAGSATITITAGSKSIEVPATIRSGYTVTVLGTLGGPGSEAKGINESGQIVGTAQGADGQWRAFLWENGSMRDLGSLGEPYNEAVAINDDGMVVGTAGHSAGDCGPGYCDALRPWIWRDGQVRTVPFDYGARFTDVNNAGAVTGYTYYGWYRFATGDAFVWKDGETTWFGPFGKGPSYPGDFKRGVALDINDAGLVAGELHYYSDVLGFAWQAGEFSYAGPVKNGSRAMAVNDQGVVAGVSADGMFEWRNGTTTLLAPAGAWPAAINSSGQIVGTVPERLEMNRFGFLWTEGTLADLNHLLPSGSEYTFDAATGINDRGQVVGFGKNAAGSVVALLLTPAE